jgi:hypothetical protein
MIGLLISIICGLVSSVVWLAFTAFWIWMLVECVTKEPPVGHDKLIWALLIIFVPYLGALLYYIVRRPERYRMYGM